MHVPHATQSVLEIILAILNPFISYIIQSLLIKISRMTRNICVFSIAKLFDKFENPNKGKIFALLTDMESRNMKKIMYRLLYLILPLLFLSPHAFAQTKVDGQKTIVANTVELDKLVHDFGDVMMTDETLHCSFSVKNISKKPIVIFNVVSSCGCTNVKWTREPLTPGKTGKINVDYTNDSGPYPFDKTLTVYISNIKKPVVLRLRGVVHSKKKPLSEIYPVRFGNLGIKKTDIKLGNLKQGNSKGDSFKVANLGQAPLKIGFADMTEGLEVSISPNPIPANSVATVSYSIYADQSKWGKNYYRFTPLVGGRKYTAKEDGKTVSQIGIWSFTVEDFSDWTKEEMDKASQPIFKTSSYTFPKVKKGAKVTARFSFTNRGKSPAVIHKIDCDWPKSKSTFQETTQPGKSSEITVELDTAGMPEGDVMWTILATTNCPLRPYISLYIYGTIE